MKRYILLILFTLACYGLSAQEWVVPVEGEWYFDFCDMISVDEGESALGIGCTRTEDGYIAKVTKDGDYVCREVHLPGMMLEYCTAVQLDDGNYMVFGVCDDSLCDFHIQKYLRVDVFDNQLEFVFSKMYDVDDGVFECFYMPRASSGYRMRSIVSKTGTPILAAILSYLEETNFGYHYVSALRFYEFDDSGDTIRTVDNPLELARVGAIKEITYEPYSDNLMLVIDGGEFGYDSGSPGIYVADADLNIVAHQSMLRLGGADVIDDNACEGTWFDGDRILVDCKQYIGTHFSYHTLYIVDSALHVYADLRLPPNDTCTEISYGTNTAYINDSTIFAFSFSGNNLYQGNVMQVNVTLVDKHLNLLGRKVIKKDDVICYVSSPAAFNDGGCAVLMYSSNGQHYPGEPFHKFDLMKFRREDIEITWDVLEEKEALYNSCIYPNPTQGIINIPLKDRANCGTRIQIFDAKGMKCFDCAVNKSGHLITLDIQPLESGVYIYKVISGSQSLAEGKFIKE